MTAALARRDDGCASDLLMDRWLLGEIPGSDEGRRLEAHVRECQSCAARLLALRSLYRNKPPPKTQEPLPPLQAPPKVMPPEHAAVLQVVILRDNLLVGTEVFTAGRYTVGSAPTCALVLEDLPPVHAAISLCAERVGLEAASGDVFVNGFRANRCELRPIDEVAVGPYVLRTRVFTERFVRPQLRAVQAEPPARPVEQRPALKLELFWGERLIDVEVTTDPKDLRRFGIESAQRIDGGWQLDGLRVAHGESQRFHVGHLVCVATQVKRAAPVPGASASDWPWAVTSLAASLAAAVVALGVYAANRDEEPDFVPREIPKAVIHAFMTPKPKPQPTPARAKTARKLLRAAPIVSPQVAVKKMLGGQAIDKILKSLDAGRALPLTRKLGGLLAGIGKPQLAAPGFGLGGEQGIGSKGLKGAGELRVAGIGRGKIGGTVEGNVKHLQIPHESCLDRSAIAQVITSHVSEISRCYEQAMMREGAFSGRLVAEWTIEPDGDVSGARVKSSTVKAPAFASCTLEKIKQWKFGHTKCLRPFTVTFPFIVDAIGY